MTDKIEQIAAGLSEAARNWINSHPPDRFYDCNTGDYTVVSGLENGGILRPGFDTATGDFGHTYTQAGINVWDMVRRKHLSETGNG